MNDDEFAGWIEDADIVGRLLAGIGLLAALVAVAFALMIWTAARAVAAEAILEGPARVVDGDTLAIGGVYVRLKGIAAPEWSRLKKEPGGEQARDALRRLIGADRVRCRLTGETTYARAVGYCFVGRGDLQAGLVKMGAVKACPAYDPRYVKWEAEPKAAGVGVWAIDYPLPGYCLPRA